LKDNQHTQAIPSTVLTRSAKAERLGLKTPVVLLQAEWVRQKDDRIGLRRNERGLEVWDWRKKSRSLSAEKNGYSLKEVKNLIQ
jgi:hypothetical protein